MIASSYTLAAAVCSLAVTIVGMPLGRRNCIIFGNVLVIIGASLQASSWSVPQIICARVIWVSFHYPIYWTSTDNQITGLWYWCNQPFSSLYWNWAILTSNDKFISCTVPTYMVSLQNLLKKKLKKRDWSLTLFQGRDEHRIQRTRHWSCHTMCIPHYRRCPRILDRLWLHSDGQSSFMGKLSPLQQSRLPLIACTEISYCIPSLLRERLTLQNAVASRYASLVLCKGTSWRRRQSPLTPPWQTCRWRSSSTPTRRDHGFYRTGRAGKE